MLPMSRSCAGHGLHEDAVKLGAHAHEQHRHRAAPREGQSIHHRLEDAQADSQVLQVRAMLQDLTGSNMMRPAKTQRRLAAPAHMPGRLESL